MDDQRQHLTTGGPRHRAPGAGPDDERFLSVRRRVGAAPLADPAWLGRLRADARSTGRAGPPVRVGAHPTGPGVPLARPDRPDALTGLSRWRAAAGPLVALAVVVTATVAVLGAVDRGGRAVPAGPAAAVVVPASGPVSAAPRVSSPVTGATRGTRPAGSVSPAPPVRATPATGAPAPAAPATAAPAVAPATGGPRVLLTGSPVEVLEALQAIRAAAFSTGRLDLLRAVYPPGSDLLSADRASFTGLVPTGGTVVGLGFDLRDTAVSERTPVRAVVTALVRQRPVEVVSGAVVRRLPGRELGRVRVVLGRPSVIDPWVITESRPADPP